MTERLTLGVGDDPHHYLEIEVWEDLVDFYAGDGAHGASAYFGKEDIVEIIAFLNRALEIIDGNS